MGKLSEFVQILRNFTVYFWVLVVGVVAISAFGLTYVSPESFPDPGFFSSAFVPVSLPGIFAFITSDESSGALSFFQHGSNGTRGYLDLNSKDLTDEQITNATLTGYQCSGSDCNFTIILDNDNFTLVEGELSFADVNITNVQYTAPDGTLRNISDLDLTGQGNWSFNETALGFTLAGGDGFENGVRDVQTGGSYHFDENSNSLESGLIGYWKFGEDIEGPDVYDDFSIDTWLAQDSSKMNVTGGRLNFLGVLDGSNDAISKDYGSFISDSQWALRFKLNITQRNQIQTANSRLSVGMSSLPSSTGSDSSLHDGIVVTLDVKSGQKAFCFGVINNVSLHTTSGGSCSEPISVETGVYYIEIVRHSDTDAEFKIFIDEDYSELISNTIRTDASSSISDLRYFVVKNRGTGTFLASTSGTIDDMQFWDGTNETEGARVVDSSGNENHGFALNETNTTHGQDCKIGNCIYLSGDRAYFETKFDGSSLTDELTVSFWEKGLHCNESAECFNSIAIFNQTGEVLGIGLMTDLGSYNDVLFCSSGICPPGGLIISNEDDFDGTSTEWRNVVVTYDAPIMKTYIDGSLVATNTTIGGTFENQSISGFEIGRRRADNGNYFDRFLTGGIDDVRIYDRALSEEEISRMYQGSTIGVGNDFVSVKSDPFVQTVVENKTSDGIFTSYAERVLVDGKPLSSRYSPEDLTTYFYDWSDQAWKEWGIGNGSLFDGGCPNGHVRIGNGVCEAEIFFLVESARLQDFDNTNNCGASPSTFNRMNTTTTNYVGMDGGGGNDDCSRAFFEYNVSSIPDNADIENVEFHFDISTVLSSNRNCDYMQMDVRPSVSSDADVWEDITNGTVYLSDDDTCTTTGNDKSVTLYGTVASDLESSLERDWFVLGARGTGDIGTNTDGSNHLQGFASRYDSAATPYPHLKVRYKLKNTLPAEVPDWNDARNKQNFKWKYSLERSGVDLDGLVAYYKMDEAGDIIKNHAWEVGSVDSLRGLADGVPAGTHDYNYPGKIGKSVNFDGATNGFDLGTSNSQWNFMHNSTMRFTFTCWTRTNSADPSSSMALLADRGTTATNGFQIYMRNDASDDNQLYYQASNSVSVFFGGQTRNDFYPKDTDWHFIAVTMDWTKAADNLMIQVDNDDKEIFTKSGSPSNGDAAYDLRLGSDQSSWYWDGQLDECSIWTRVLTEDELTAIYNEGLGVQLEEENPAINVTHQLTASNPFVRTFVDTDSEGAHTIQIRHDLSENKTSFRESDDKLIAYWNLDEGGGHINDLSGNEISGTNFVNGPVWEDESECMFGKCMSFLGADDYVNLGDDSRFESIPEITVSAWIKTTDSTTNKAIVSKNCGGDSSWGIRLTSNVARWSLDADSTVHISASSTLNDGVWHHIVGTYDGATSKVYHDGVEENSVAVSGLIDNSNEFVALGRFGHSDCNGLDFDGYLDDVKIYGRALSASEVEQLYETGLLQSKPGLYFSENNGTDEVLFTTTNFKNVNRSTFNITSDRTDWFSYSYEINSTDNRNFLYTLGSLGEYNISTFKPEVNGSDISIESVESLTNASLTYSELRDDSLFAWYSFNELPHGNFEDDFSVYKDDYYANNSWKTIDESKMNVSIENERLDFNFRVDNTEDGIAHDLGFNTSDEKWVLRFKVEFTDINVPVSNSNYACFGLSSASETEVCTENQDFVGIRFVRSSSSNQIHSLDSADVAPYDQGDTLFSTQVAEQVYFVEIRRNSTTTYDVALFSDSEYAQLIERVGGTVSANAGEMRYFKLMNRLFNGAAGHRIDGYVDDVQIWNGISFVEDLSDRSGKENHGLAKNDPVSVRNSSCKIGNCVSFDGTDDYIEIAKSRDIQLHPEMPFTISAWVNSRNAASNQFIIGDRDGTPDGWRFDFEGGSSNLQWTFDQSTNDITCKTPASSVSSDTWHHVVVTNDGTSNSDCSGFDIYIDGVSQSLGDTSTGTVTDPTNSIPITIGSSQGSSAFMNGMMDEVKIYSRALSADEVRNDYWNTKEGHPNHFSTQITNGSQNFVAHSFRYDSGALAVWKFDEGEGATAYDSSGNGFDEPITGATWINNGSCRIGSCLYFDGSGDYIDVGQMNPSVTETTATVWFKTDTPLQDGGFISNSDGTALQRFTFELHNSNELRVGHFESGPDFNFIVTPSENVWHFAAMVHHANRIDVFYDGIWYELSGVTPDTGTLNVNIGRRSSSTYEYTGYLDEIRIYDRALDREAVESLYYAGSETYYDDFGTTASGKNNRYATVENSEDILKPFTPRGTVLHARFDDNSTVNTTDDSGYGNTGNSMGGVDWNNRSACREGFGGCLDFDGSDDEVDFGSDDSLHNIWTGGGTAFVWINPRSGGENNQGQILDKGEIWLLELQNPSGGTADLEFSQRGTTRGRWESVDKVIKFNEWQSVAIVYNKDDVDNNVPIMYVNGLPVPIVEQSDPTGSPVDDSQYTLIAGEVFNDNQAFDGLMDEIIIVNRSLSAQEIYDLHIGGQQRQSGDLITWLKFNEKAPTHSDDISGYTNVTGDGLWPSTDTGNVFVNYTNTKINSTPTIDAGADEATIAYDLREAIGEDASNDRWILRFKIDILRAVQGTDSDNLYTLMGLSDQDETVEALDNQDFIGARINMDRSGSSTDRQWEAVDGNGVDNRNFDQTDFAHAPAEESLWIEIKRISLNSYEVNLFSDPSYQILVESETPAVSSSVEDLRYIKFMIDVASSTSQDLEATFDDIQFWNGISSLQPNITFDSSGRGNFGEVLGGVSSVSGKHERAVQFDGVDDYIDMGTWNPGEGDHTINFWMKTSEQLDASGHYMIDRRSGTNKVSVRYTASTDTLGYILGTGSDVDTLATVDLNDGEWHMITAVRNTGTGNSSLYADGSLVATEVITGVGNLIDATFNVGRFTGDSSYYNGSLDNLKIFDRVLTEEEILHEYLDNQDRNSIHHNVHRIVQVSASPVIIYNTTDIDSVYQDGHDQRKLNFITGLSAGGGSSQINLTVQHPTNITYGIDDIWINATVDGSNTDDVVFSLDGGANVSMTNSSGNWNNLTENVTVGSHSITVYANDTVLTPATPQTIFFTVGQAVNTITINPSVAFWNDTINASGLVSGGDSVNVIIEGNSVCSLTASSEGYFNCTFFAPLEVGTYNVTVTYPGQAQYFDLNVRPTYGSEPIGTTPRAVLEIPIVSQEPSGMINNILTRITISR